MDNQEIKVILKEVVDLILREKFEKLYNKDSMKRVKPEWIEESIREYPGKITYPPEDAYNDFEVYEIENNKNGKEVNIDFYSWFNEEKSDLMIQLKLIESQTGLYYGMWDIYVP